MFVGTFVGAIVVGRSDVDSKVVSEKAGIEVSDAVGIVIPPIDVGAFIGGEVS